GLASLDSRSIILDTRYSASAAADNSSGFTLDTRSAVVADVLISGRVTDTNGVGLASAVVSALQGSVLRGQAATDGGGNYALPPLPAGTYQLRAETASY